MWHKYIIKLESHNLQVIIISILDAYKNYQRTGAGQIAFFLFPKSSRML